jgi:hypothetical protein
MRPLFLLALTCFAAGCGGSKVGLVSGKVTLDGKPLANARVNFQPIGDTVHTGVGSFGKADDHGEYTLNLIDGSAPGAMVGKHRVAISAYDESKAADPNDDRRKGPPDRVPLRYNVQTELTFEVKPGPNTANFDLKSR